ncbi:unnamed protein product, partial [Coregonus sp. 'balchen']
MESVRADMLDPAQTVPVQMNLVQTNTVQSDIVQTETDQTDLVHTEMVRATETVQRDFVQTETVQTDFVQTDNQTETTDSTFIETVKNEIVQLNFNQTETVQTDPVLTETVYTVQTDTAQMEPVHSETVLTDIMQTVTVQRDPAPTDFTEIIQTDMGQRAGNCHSGDPDGRAGKANCLVSPTAYVIGLNMLMSHFLAHTGLYILQQPESPCSSMLSPDSLRRTPSPQLRPLLARRKHCTACRTEGWQCMLWRDLSDLAELQDYSGTNRELCMSPPDQMVSLLLHRACLGMSASFHLNMCIWYSKSLDRLEACFGKELGKTFEGILHPSLLVNPHQREAECGVECRTRGGQGE